jgi:putative PIN family toxin of toxin-antitoxin system
MKVVIDTNVVISAALKDRNPEAVIRFIIRHPDDFEWVASQEIIDEYLTVLRRKKFNILPEDLAQWESVFARLITLFEVGTQIDFPRDQKDAKYLACALSIQADYLISGDKDFDAAHKMGKTTILSVAKFKQLVSDIWE